MKSLIFAVAILLLVNGCTGESSEPAPVAKAEQTEQTEQTEPDNQVNQVRRGERKSRESTSAYQNAIRAKIRNSSKDTDSNDDKDG